MAIGTGIIQSIGGKIALIDSERGSASKYADKFEFETVDLEKKNIDEYVSFINEAAKAGYNVLIIDSLSHAWQELLEEVERIARAKFKGNTWSAWSEGTPKQRKLIDAILDYPGHVMVTMRSKTEWVIEKTSDGKNTPQRVGLAPEQGKGIEYEFDLLMEMTPDHFGNVVKDRTGKFQDSIIEKPGIAFGKELIAWLNSGEDVIEKPKPEPTVNVATPPKTPPASGDKFGTIMALWEGLGRDLKDIKSELKAVIGKDSSADMTEDDCDKFIAHLQGLKG